MLSKLRPRSVYDVAAALALFIALGGTAYAVAANSVGTAQLKDGAVTKPKLATGSVGTGKVIDGSLLRKDFKAGQVPAATHIVVRRQDVVPPAAPFESIWSVGCSAGEKVVGGGVVRVTSNGHFQERSNDAMQISAPVTSGDSPSLDGETPARWLSALAYTDAPLPGERIRHYAICARPSG